MTSTTPSYLKRAGQGRPARRAYAQWRAEQRRVLPCFARALVYAPAPLFFFSLPPVLRKSKCVRSSFIPPSLYPTRDSYAHYLSFSPHRLSVSLLLCFVSVVSYALLSLRPICFTYATFSLYTRTRRATTCALTQKRRKLFYTHQSSLRRG